MMAHKLAEESRAKVLVANTQQQLANMGRSSAGPARFDPNTMHALFRVAGGSSVRPVASASASTSASAPKAKVSATPTEAPDPDRNAVDTESRHGRFGWAEFESKTYIPYLFRKEFAPDSAYPIVEKYVSVRMVEHKLLHRFLSQSPSEIFSCYRLRSFFITETESKLLNAINVWHSDRHYGTEPFSTKDLVVKLNDAKEFCGFLDLCHMKLGMRLPSLSDRCGFFRIDNKSIVPFTVISNNVTVVPMFYFEGASDNLSKLKSETISGWDLAHLKFCCKVQGIRSELYAGEVCRVVALDELKACFPPESNFERFWPSDSSLDILPRNHWREKVSGVWTHKSSWTAAMSSGPPVSSAASASTATVQTAAPQFQQYRQQEGIVRQAGVPGQQPHRFLPRQNSVSSQGSSAASVNSPQQYHMTQSPNYLTQSPQMNQANNTTQTFLTAAQWSKPSATFTTSEARSSEAAKEIFQGKLKQVKEFTGISEEQALHQQEMSPPYKMMKARIEGQTVMPCINVRPHLFKDVLVTFPDFVETFCPDLSPERARHMIQDVLKIDLYKGNRGQQVLLLLEGKCKQFNPVPLILAKDIVSHASQMKTFLSEQPDSSQNTKRLKLG